MATSFNLFTHQNYTKKTEQYQECEVVFINEEIAVMNGRFCVTNGKIM